MLSLRPLLLCVLIICLAGCGGCGKLVPDALKPDSEASAIPRDVRMAVGSKHDLLVAACRDRINWLDVLTPTIVAGIFVGLGRLDAIFYVPEATLQALIPECGEVEYEVRNARIDGTDDIELVPTENPAAFTLTSTLPTTGVFRADVLVAGELIEVEASVDVEEPDTLEWEFECDRTAVDGYEIVEDRVGVGFTAWAKATLRRNGIELGGYGLDLIEGDGVEVVDEGHRLGVTFKEPGQKVLTSPFDEDFSVVFDVFEHAAVEELVVSTDDSHAAAFEGGRVPIQVLPLIDGALSCSVATRLMLQIDTPEVCTWPAGDLVNEGWSSLDALGPGVCRGQIRIPEADLVTGFEREILPWFRTTMPAPEGVLLAAPFAVSGEQFFSARALGNAVQYAVDGVWQELEVPERIIDIDAVDGHAYALTRGTPTAEDVETSVWRWDGLAWTEHALPEGSTNYAQALAARAADDVYVVLSSRLLHFDGSDFTTYMAPADDGRFTDIYVAPTGEIFVLGIQLYEFDGTSFTSVLEFQGSPPHFVTGSGVDDLWLSGGYGFAGRAMRFDGQDWTEVLLGGQERLGLVRFNTLWPVPQSDEVWLLRTEPRWLEHWDGTHLLTFPERDGIDAVDMVAEGNELYLLTTGGVMHMTYAP